MQRSRAPARRSSARSAAIRASYARKASVGGYGAYYKRRAPARRYPRRVSGYGSYVPTEKVVEAIQKPASNYIREGLLKDLGGNIGELAQGLSRRIFGFGAYHVQQNSLWDSIRGQQTPQVVNSGESWGRVIIRHREFLGDISGSTSFVMQRTLALNPGLPETFPWLSAVAQNFERYRFRGLLFHFKSTSADALNSINTALGTNCFSTYYNTHTPAPQDKQTLEAAEYSSSCKPSEDMLHPIECAASQTNLKEWYVRSGPVPSGADQSLYDLGVTYFATTGMQAAAVIGEMWVTYEVELVHSIMPPSQGIIQTDHFQLGTTPSSTHPLGTAPTLVTESNLGCTIDSTGTIISFPQGLQQGSYMIVWTIKGTSGALAVPSVSFANCTYVPIWNGDANSFIHNGGTTGGQWIFVNVVNLSGTQATVTFGTAGTYPTSPTSGDLVITSFNAEVTTLLSDIKKQVAKVITIDPEDESEDTEDEDPYILVPKSDRKLAKLGLKK